jgi:hypothetical protein
MPVPRSVLTIAAATVHYADDVRRDGEVRQRWKYGPRLARGQ